MSANTIESTRIPLHRASPRRIARPPEPPPKEGVSILRIIGLFALIASGAGVIVVFLLILFGKALAFNPPRHLRPFGS
jgi:hypothetical protein